MNKQKQYIVLVSGILFFIVKTLLVYSFLFPNQLKWIDYYRFYLQSNAIQWLCSIPTSQDNERTTIKTINQLADHSQIGDLIFTSHQQNLMSHFIPGNWKHVAIYLGSKEQVVIFFDDSPQVLTLLDSYYKTGDELLILEANTAGVIITNLKVSKDKRNSRISRIATLRLSLNHDNIKKYIKYGIGQLGKAYDYDLVAKDTSKMYCSEIVFHALNQVNIHLQLKEKLYNRKFLSPQSLSEQLTNKHGLLCVWHSKF